jgi:hypothetical protein
VRRAAKVKVIAKVAKPFGLELGRGYYTGTIREWQHNFFLLRETE